MTRTISYAGMAWRRAALIWLAALAWPASAWADNLYQAQQFRSLFADRRAVAAGDMLTVLVYENASATTSAGTSADKTSSTRLGVQGKNSQSSVGVDANDSYEGSGRIQRSGKLLAQITVTVQSVDASGSLLVKGQQLIEVNDEKQEIKLEGRIRPNDIGENNTVISSRLADARISYIGEGVLADRQRPGLVTRLMHWLGLI
ncbi:flagellar basal body L-ring protein FlgH [Lacisediminimonas sp.]|uniref:flagellar basal body L-ring protein FlgH n=1 Tax=Lacisediminimonas sp. TaxID=3060582 RepID=UPI00271612D2|nr:flagellar basal body L-ring protein FlgH [Lacisediminimonas sp.]MDO8299540.1 flagellar basal body L-ring protein FlgH [Lacisediminimonas sp.]MDO9216154.1 flagellar basal body L-ring protein FlgH [Lacisediminimonas sp.]